MFLTLFVDDGLLAEKIEKDMIEILNRLNHKFEVTFNIAHHGHLTYLGMQIRNDSTGIFINQSTYTEKILQRFKFDSLNSASNSYETWNGH